MTTTPRWARTWKETVCQCLDNDWTYGITDARKQFGRSLRGLLVDTMNAANRVKVLGAHASRPARPAGLGPLLATIAGEGVAL